MPSLYGAGVSVRLAAQPLADSLTPTIVFKKGYMAAQQCDAAEKALRESTNAFLNEERVQFPSDDGNFAVNWLGGVPFMQVVVRRNPSENAAKFDELRHKLVLSDGDTTSVENGRSSLGMSTRSGRTLSSTDAESDQSTPARLFQGRRPSGLTTVSPPHGRSTASATLSPLAARSDCLPQDVSSEPKALILHVLLTDKTFFHNPFQNSPQHLKIDVFFNGQLSSCVLVHTHDIRSHVKSLDQIFAGTRVDYMAERPWVIYAQGETSGMRPRAAKDDGVQGRWTQICKALMSEAKDRGYNEHGERPPTAAYLHELAGMHMPNGVKNMQNAGGRTFGVIDVIVTVGSGKKVKSNGTAYLKTPTRLVDERYDYEMEGEADLAMSNGGLVSTADREAGATHFNEEETFVPDQLDKGESPGFEFLSSAPASASLPHTRLPPPSLPPAFHSPFTGAHIPPLPPLGSSTSFFYSSSPTPNPGFAAADVSRIGGQVGKRRYSEYVALVEDSRQSQSLRPSYPSAHAPSIPTATVSRLRMRDTSVDRSNTHGQQPYRPSSEFNVNQYDSFVHANPYQLPYADMMAGLEFDGPTSIPLRHGSLGQLTLRSFNPTPTKVVPSMMSNSPLESSPYQGPRLPTSQGNRVSFGSVNVTSYNPAAPPKAAPADLGISSAGNFSRPGSVISSSPLLHTGPTSIQPASCAVGHNPVAFPKATPPDMNGPGAGGFSQPGNVFHSSPLSQPSQRSIQAGLYATNHNSVASPKASSADHDKSGVGGFSRPGNVFGSSPIQQFSPRSLQAGLYATEPCLRPPNKPSDGPPPPVGYFKVTEKPKTALSNIASSSSEKPSEPGHVVRRLVINGKDGTPIVDHRWEIPKRFLTKNASNKTDSTGTPLTRSPVKSPRASPDSVDYAESFAVRRRKSRTVHVLATPPATSPNTTVDPDKPLAPNKANRDSVHERPPAAALAKSAAFFPALASNPSDRTRDIEKTTVPTKFSSPMESSAIRHRTISSGILGVQGPKAAMFVLDNPEELLRKGTKTRTHSRSLSSTKLPTEATTGPVKAIVARTVDGPIDSGGLDTDLSSPLSSLSNSPQLSATGQTNTDNDVDMSYIPAAGSLLNVPTAPIDRTPSIQTHSSATSSVSATAATGNISLAMAVRSPEPPKKKRGLGSTPSSRVRPTRSPDRLSATDNPPLNENCVLQYAVSEKAGGALRQVKCEKQGVFTEESVVVGMRFFVPG